ncbi:MAG TPA: HAD hydrolase-like protein, partial [Candidatus Avoscillospira stercoripullorum]|nr:HAD hydrolase-like protein [Candidatus Avoscillospira stercoripullorum]
CLLLGDSLTSDMQGGRNAGVDTCFLGKLKSDPRCDYIVEDLLDVLPLLGIHQAK